MTILTSSLSSGLVSIPLNSNRYSRFLSKGIDVVSGTQIISKEGRMMTNEYTHMCISQVKESGSKPTGSNWKMIDFLQIFADINGILLPESSSWVVQFSK